MSHAPSCLWPWRKPANTNKSQPTVHLFVFLLLTSLISQRGGEAAAAAAWSHKALWCKLPPAHCSCCPVTIIVFFFFNQTEHRDKPTAQLSVFLIAKCLIVTWRCLRGGGCSPSRFPCQITTMPSVGFLPTWWNYLQLVPRSISSLLPVAESIARTAAVIQMPGVLQINPCGSVSVGAFVNRICHRQCF